MSAYIIRQATPDDAEQVIAHVKRIADEPNNGIAMSSSAEFTMTVEEEREFLAKAAAADNELYLVAEAAGAIIGTAHCRPPSPRFGFRHTASLGISVHRDWRGRGVGTALMQGLIDFARENPRIKRLELSVFHNNPGAIHVYEKLGFQHEGVRRSAFYKEGQFLDMIFMAIVFEKDIIV